MLNNYTVTQGSICRLQSKTCKSICSNIKYRLPYLIGLEAVTTIRRVLKFDVVTIQGRRLMH